MHNLLTRIANSIIFLSREGTTNVVRGVAPGQRGTDAANVDQVNAIHSNIVIADGDSANWKGVGKPLLLIDQEGDWRRRVEAATGDLILERFDGADWKFKERNEV